MGVFKLWQFLESWGIINYQAGAGAAEDADGVAINVQPAGQHAYGLPGCPSNSQFVDVYFCPRQLSRCAYQMSPSELCKVSMIVLW